VGLFLPLGENCLRETNSAPAILTSQDYFSEAGTKQIATLNVPSVLTNCFSKQIGPRRRVLRECMTHVYRTLPSYNCKQLPIGTIITTEVPHGEDHNSWPKTEKEIVQQEKRRYQESRQEVSQEKVNALATWAAGNCFVRWRNLR
jgi:hypothetical protein